MTDQSVPMDDTDCDHPRQLPASSPFAGDDGSADPQLVAALAGHECGELAAVAVVEAMRGKRLLVPILAHEKGTHAGAATVVGVTAPDGRVAMPVFTCVAELAAWHPGARPLPVVTEQVALAAIDEGWQVLVVDPASRAFFVPRPAVAALMTGREWRPAVVDGRVAESVQRVLQVALADVPGITTVLVAPGTSSEVMVIVTVSDDSQRELLAASVPAALAASPEVIALVDSCEVRFVRRDLPQSSAV